MNRWSTAGFVPPPPSVFCTNDTVCASEKTFRTVFSIRERARGSVVSGQDRPNGPPSYPDLPRPPAMNSFDPTCPWRPPGFGFDKYFLCSYFRGDFRDSFPRCPGVSMVRSLLGESIGRRPELPGAAPPGHCCSPPRPETLVVCPSF